MLSQRPQNPQLINPQIIGNYATITPGAGITGYNKQNPLLLPSPTTTGNTVHSNATNPSMLYKAIQLLKQDNQNIHKQYEQREKNHEEDKRKMKLQMQAYRKKIIQLSQLNIVNGIANNPTNGARKETKEEDTALKIRKLELQVQHIKSQLNQKTHELSNSKSQIQSLALQLQTTQSEKNMHLQLSLSEKIGLQQKIQLLTKELASKKNIINGLETTMKKMSQHQAQVARKEREIIRRGRDMTKYEEEFGQYQKQCEAKWGRRVEGLQKENKFLRKEIKKLMKAREKGKTCGNQCNCQIELEDWKKKVYQVGRQLAKARVQLGRNQAITDKQKDKRRIKLCQYERQKKQKQEKGEEQLSIDSLSLSEESQQCISEDDKIERNTDREANFKINDAKKTQKKRF